MEICSIPLYWEKVDCDKYEPKKPAKKVEEEEEGGISGWIAYPFVFLSWVWQMHIVAIVTLPKWLFLATIALVDWLLDWVWLGLFGWWCMPCAGFFIWIINIALFPFTLFAWI